MKKRKIRLFLPQLREDSSSRWGNLIGLSGDRTGLWSDSGLFGLGGVGHTGWVQVGWLSLKRTVQLSLATLVSDCHRSPSVMTLDRFVFFGWILKCWESIINGPSKEANCLLGLIHIQQSWGAPPDCIDHLLPSANCSTLSPKVTAWYQITPSVSAILLRTWTAEAKSGQAYAKGHMSDLKNPRRACLLMLSVFCVAVKIPQMLQSNRTELGSHAKARCAN